MAKKNGSRLVHKETGIQNKKHDIPPDEITLRDEIFALKRQVMILKKTNEQYLVKLRKYEDEGKRKDKQLEQLMDPRKNSDITKVLSTKGAAILMNLKDQNNSLIQMIMNKDLHIRRLAAEIKMSKLYASPKTSEGYRAEISRLRNLLIKSQETLKENVDVHEQSRSLRVGGNSFLEFSSSSDQSSPRDLDELRLTILNLESHIEQSNDLLVKKNEEISLLKDEVNFLKTFLRNKTLKNKSFTIKPTQSKEYELSSTNITSNQPEEFVPTKTLSLDNIDLFQRNSNLEYEKLLNPAQSTSKKWVLSIDSIPKYNFQSYGAEERAELIEVNQENTERVNKTCSIIEKSLFHHFAEDEVKRKEKIFSKFNTLKDGIHPNERWKKAFNKYKELKKLNPHMFSGCVQVEVYRKHENEETEFSKDDNEDTIKIIQNNHKLEQENHKNVDCKFDNSKNAEPFTKKEKENILKTLASNHISDNEVSETCQNSGKESCVSKSEENYETDDNYLASETHTVQGIQHIESQSPRDGRKAKTTKFIQNSSIVEVKSKCVGPFLENYYYSLDSSFDSDYDYSVKQMQVEVQINSASPQSDNDQSQSNISKTNQIYKYDTENNGNRLDFNDDDDVIIRDK